MFFVHFRRLSDMPRPALCCVPNWLSDSRLPPDSLRRHLHHSVGCFAWNYVVCAGFPQAISNLFYDIGPLVSAKTWDFLHRTLEIGLEMGYPRCLPTPPQSCRC